MVSRVKDGSFFPHWETAIHVPLSVLVKILLKTAVPAGHRGGPGHLGLQPLTRTRLRHCEDLGSVFPRGRGPTHGTMPGASLGPAPPTAALTGLGLLDSMSPGQVATLAEGREWSLESSPAQNWTPPQSKLLTSTAHR